MQAIQVTILFSDRGTPKTYRHMNGYSSHTFKWYNDKGEHFWINYQLETDQGIENLTGEESVRLKGEGSANGKLPAGRIYAL